LPNLDSLTDVLTKFNTHSNTELVWLVYGYDSDYFSGEEFWRGNLNPFKSKLPIRYYGYLLTRNGTPS